MCRDLQKDGLIRTRKGVLKFADTDQNMFLAFVSMGSDGEAKVHPAAGALVDEFASVFLASWSPSRSRDWACHSFGTRCKAALASTVQAL